MTVEQLEKIALESNKGKYRGCGCHSSTLKEYGKRLRLDIHQRIKNIKQSFPNQVIIAVDLGCSFGDAAAGLNRKRGVQGFGIDESTRDHFNHELGLNLNRYIMSDLENMSNIPDASFHYAISSRVLAATDITKSIPEIFRILMPGGIADFNLADDLYGYLEEIESIEIMKYVTLVALHTKFRAHLPEYLNYIEHEANGTDSYRASEFLRYEMHKPTDYKPKPNK